MSVKIKSKPFSVLYIEFDKLLDKKIQDLYLNNINKHNLSVSNDLYPNSGFDIFNTKNLEFTSNQTKLVNFGIKGAMFTFNNSNAKTIPVYNYVQEAFERKLNKNITPQPYQIFTRSSIWKSGFRLANNVGIIDSGYRGYLFGSMHNIFIHENSLKYSNRYLQICKPDLLPFYIQIVNKLVIDSKRGNGGSTGY